MDEVNIQLKTQSYHCYEIIEAREESCASIKKIIGHLVFGIKLGFTSKARFVSYRKLKNPTQPMTYSSVVFQDTVKVLIMVPALYDLDVRLFDVGNA